MERDELSPKVIATYQAVAGLLKEGADLNALTVSEITARAGIGKGTVYEYFSNKEEILAGALFYETSEVCRSLYQSLKGKKNLYEKLECIMIDMENHIQEVGCSFKLLHLMMDNSQISKQLRELFKKKMEDEMPILVLFRQLIEDELEETAQISHDDLAYLVMGVISRMMGYAMYLKMEIFDKASDNSIMRMRLCRDICREVEDFK